MAKIEKKQEPKSKPAKKLTTAQAVKKAENIRKYNARNLYLDQRRRLAIGLRCDFGYIGSDDQVIAQHGDKLFAEAQANAAEVKAELEAEAKMEAARNAAEQAATRATIVQDALDGPKGTQLKRWLATRPATFERVSRFMAKAA